MKSSRTVNLIMLLFDELPVKPKYYAIIYLLFVASIFLAQTLWIVLAKSASIPCLRVLTSIKREDSLIAGKSFYFAEIEILLACLQEASSNDDCLFLLDEIYRGTNRIERIASSVAVLDKLATNNLVMVTTHDVELQELLSGYVMFHFSENADTKNLFSYLIQDGPCNTRNAIELLRLVGYPRDVVNRASRLANDMTN